MQIHTHFIFRSANATGSDKPTNSQTYVLKEPNQTLCFDFHQQKNCRKQKQVLNRVFINNNKKRKKTTTDISSKQMF